jgi:predicted dithiol-disulfide oxidoreductase (DUF899 family)
MSLGRRRRLPMVEITKDYVFEGPDGQVGLLDLFEGRRMVFGFPLVQSASVRIASIDK